MSNIKRNLFIYIFVFCSCLLPFSVTAQVQNGQPVSENADAQTLEKLRSLEKQAADLYDNRQYANALERYQEYEILVRQAGYDVVQPDLLYNQALAALKAQKFGYAIACLQQLDIIAPSQENRKKLSALQSLVEYNISQEHPDAVFVRGKSDRFQTWQRVRRYSKTELFYFVGGIWTAFFLIIGIVFFLPYFYERNPLKLFLSLILFQLLLIGALIVIISNRQSTENLQFAVLLDSDGLQSDLSPNPKPFSEPGFSEGLVVEVVQQSDKWALIERADGKTAWVAIDDIYKLRSADSATMNLGIQASQQSQNSTDPHAK